MTLSFLIKPVILFIVAVFLIRLTGRRSIAQMTIAQTVMIISIGAIIVEPFADKDMKKTIVVATIYIVLLIIFEVTSYYVKWFKKLAVGDKVIIIKEGKFDEPKLKQLRLTKEEVLSRLRQEGIPKLDYVEEGTLEPNGEFGFKLTAGAEPLRVQDMAYILNEILSAECKRQISITPEDIVKQAKE